MYLNAQTRALKYLDITSCDKLQLNLYENSSIFQIFTNFLIIKHFCNWMMLMPRLAWINLWIEIDCLQVGPMPTTKSEAYTCDSYSLLATTWSETTQRYAITMAKCYHDCGHTTNSVNENSQRLRWWEGWMVGTQKFDWYAMIC